MFYVDGEVDSDVVFFFVSYIFLATAVLFNVVIAVLLDEFISFIAHEKETAARLRDAEMEKMRITSPLDPLTQTLTAFDDEEDLDRRIDEIYNRLDTDDSNGLNYNEFQEGLKHITIKDRHSESNVALNIHLTRGAVCVCVCVCVFMWPPDPRC